MNGELDKLLKGKYVAAVLYDDNYLHIELDDGHVVVIGWRDQQNNLLRGCPTLESVNVKIRLDPMVIGGSVGVIGGT